MLIWTKPAKQDVMEYITNAKFNTQNIVKQYFINLSNYLEILNIMPFLGKKLNLFPNDLHIRQIIYRSHKVVYLVKDHDVYILTVLHSKMDTKTIISKIIDALN